jgi:lipopolysaccharide/colanic/teichoic acid biosynthesis glycosyltransferase
MTGLASLVFSDEERALDGVARPEDYYFDVVLPRKMAIESLYVQRKNVWLDLRILALTPLAIIFPGIARRYLQARLTGNVPSVIAKEWMG